MDETENPRPNETEQPSSAKNARKPREKSVAPPVIDVVSDVALPIRRGRKQLQKRKKRPEIGVLCDMGVLSLFAVAALATGHEHWRKTPEKVRAATEPLQAMIEELPAKTLKAVERKLNPCLFAIAMGMLVIPDVAEEISLRRTENAGQRRSQQPAFRTGTGQPAGAEGARLVGSNGGGPVGEEQPVGYDYLAADPLLRGLDQ